MCLCIGWLIRGIKCHLASTRRASKFNSVWVYERTPRQRRCWNNNITKRFSMHIIYLYYDYLLFTFILQYYGNAKIVHIHKYICSGERGGGINNTLLSYNIYFNNNLTGRWPHDFPNKDQFPDILIQNHLCTLNQINKYTSYIKSLLVVFPKQPHVWAHQNPRDN